MVRLQVEIEPSTARFGKRLTNDAKTAKYYYGQPMPFHHISMKQVLLRFFRNAVSSIGERISSSRLRAAILRPGKG
jgi:hypothetical protein